MILAFSAMASVVINEMELNPPKGGAEWIELYNSGNESVDISGWTATITDGSWRGELSAVPEGTILPAGGFYVMDGLKSWNHTNGGYATLFTASGEEVDRTAFRPSDGGTARSTTSISPDGGALLIKKVDDGRGRSISSSRPAALPGSVPVVWHDRTVPTTLTAADPEVTPTGSEPGPAAVAGHHTSGRTLVLFGTLLAVALMLALPIRTWLAQKSSLEALRGDIDAAQQRVEGLQTEQQQWLDPLFIEAQARKRLAVEFEIERVVSWDHTKITGY